MKRHFTRASQTVLDLSVLFAAFGLSYLIRFDWTPPAQMVGRFLLAAPYVVLVEYAILVLSGVPRIAWRHIGLDDVARIAGATTASTMLLVLSRLVMGELQLDVAYLRHGVVPLGVIGANGVLALLGIVGVRAARRIQIERKQVRAHELNHGEEVRTILIGAGSAGALVAREVAAGRSDTSLALVGFLDDDASKRDTRIHRVPVVGRVDDLVQVTEALDARQVLITMRNPPGKLVRRVRDLATQAQLELKILPGFGDIVEGRVNLSRIREVAIEDLLRRDPIVLDDEQIQAIVEAKTVMVTGGGGSIGSELCRQICQFEPRELLLVERAENNLFDIHRELVAKFPNLSIVPLVCDVTDSERIGAIFDEHRPSVVLHAAAHKHVPMMEWNPGEAVKNNAFGSRIVADLAHRFGAETFVMISTDKAVNPTSVMGATKRAAEIYIQALGRRSETRFVTVRFGNVLGSKGSVIPIFKEQIARGGPVTVTHPEMQRYFMTIPEACQLVLQAASMGTGAEIFILDMGQPVKIVDLARDLIALSGLREGEDIEVTFTGTRPGEKLFEELATDQEHADRTRHPKIFVGHTREEDVETVEAFYDALDQATRTNPNASVIPCLQRFIPEFVPPSLREDERPPACERQIAESDALSVERPVPAAQH